ncbi:MAG: hypothetical protein J0H42_09720 [Rhizobiales bacterium]|nr:hypothetical protein [Hyphomicrobiales bacterium]
MLKDGTYAAWFKTPTGHGTGIVHVADGRIWGRDGVMTYEGSCEVEGDRFTAVVITKRHTNGRPTVFGDDQELELKLEGRSAGKIATYMGTAKQFPGVLLEGTLIFSEQAHAQKENQPLLKFNPDKLPKLPARTR